MGDQMNERHRQWTDRFSEHLAGELGERESVAVERHLAECGPCRLVLEELREVVSRVRGVQDLQPPRDLWPGIAAAIQTPIRVRTEPAVAKVIVLPTAEARREPAGPSSVTLTPPQLAAAAIILIAVSVITTAWAGPGLGVRPELVLDAQPTTAVTMVADLPAPPERLSDELAVLEDVLEAARATLDPNTVRVLQRSLGVIERAIADSREALALDPENEFLAHHLDRVYERKLAYLRDATLVLDWAG